MQLAKLVTVDGIEL